MTGGGLGRERGGGWWGWTPGVAMGGDSRHRSNHPWQPVNVAVESLRIKYLKAA